MNENTPTINEALKCVTEPERLVQELKERLAPCVVEDAPTGSPEHIKLELKEALRKCAEPVPPTRTNVTQPPSRTGEHYDAVGKVRWTLKSQLAELQAKRFCFVYDGERRDISLAITHLEDALHRLERVIDNGAQNQIELARTQNAAAC